MTKSVRIEVSIVLLTSFVIVLLSLFQTVAFAHRAPSDATYPLVHGYAQDYYWYLSLMEQGKEGNFLVTTRYTAELFHPQFINTFFPMLGAIAGVLGISLPVMFLIARIVSGTLVYAIGYVLLLLLFSDRKQRVAGYIFMIIGAPLWYVDSGHLLHLVGEVWSGLDPLVRNVYLPHHMAADVLMVMSFICLYRLGKTNLLRFAFAAGICSFIAGWINPAIIIILGMAILLGTGISLIQYRIKKELIIGTGISLVFTVMPIPLYYVLQNSVFPWTAFRDWERFNFYPFDVPTFIGALGIVGIIALIGIPLVIRKKNLLWNLIIGWYLAPIIGLGILQYILPVSNSRYLQGAYHIPAALLAAQSLIELNRTIRLRHRKIFQFIVLVVISVFSFPSFWASVSQQLRSVDRDSRNLDFSVPNKVMAGIEWLGEASPPGAVVLAPEWVSTMIPAFTDKRVLLGHPTFTYKADVKQALVSKFYSFDDVVNARRILITTPVTYIWTEAGNKPVKEYLRAMDVTSVYENSVVTIFKVNR